MNRNELIRELFHYQESELAMKDYYEKHHRLCSFDYYKTILTDGKRNKTVPYEMLPSDIWSPNAIYSPANIRNTQDNASFFYLTEYIFDRMKSDVILSKHPRYSPYFLHSHAYFELVFVYQGSCINTIEQNSISMVTGDLCIIPPDIIHAITVTDDSIILNIIIRTNTFQSGFGILYKSENMLAEFFRQILYSDTFRKYLLFHTRDDTSISDMVLDMMLQQINGKAYRDYIINGNLISFCGILLQNHESDADLPNAFFSKESFIPNILSYIDTHYAEITLYELAEHFHLNSRYLSRLLKENTGKTFQTLITGIRMEKAGQMLLSTACPIRIVSEQTGYNDQTYFMKAFKKYYGCTPSQYRLHADKHAH